MKLLKPLLCIVAIFFISINVNAKDNAEKLGDAIYILSPAIAYGSTFYKDDPQGRMQFYKSILTNTAITLGLKYSIKKQRPNGKDTRSFPSGHTSASFQSAAFLHNRYGFKAAIPLYLGATYVAYNRIDSKNHYTEDVLAGALIGGLSSYYFTSAFKPYHKHITQLSPVFSKNTIGLQLHARW